MDRVNETMWKKPFVFAVFALINSACLSTFFGSKDSKSENYHLPAPGSGWTAIDPAEADAAYRNKVDQAILNVSSVCGEDRFRSLEDLSKDIFTQLPEHTIVQAGEARNIDGHPALVSEARGTVDGESLSVRIAVIRTPKCLYDFILAGSTLDTTSREAFDKVLNGFQDGSKP